MGQLTTVLMRGPGSSLVIPRGGRQLFLHPRVGHWCRCRTGAIKRLTLGAECSNYYPVLGVFFELARELVIIEYDPFLMGLARKGKVWFFVSCTGGVVVLVVQAKRKGCLAMNVCLINPGTP